MPDEAARQRLLARIGDIDDFSLPRPEVTLEEFFEGNDDPESIGYNLADGGPGPQAFYRALRAVRDRPDVADVLVIVKDHENIDGWPSADEILVVTAASPDEVSTYLSPEIAPDEWVEQQTADGRRAVCLFWD